MAEKAGRQADESSEDILGSDALFDDFSDLETRNSSLEQSSLDNIETMLIDINEEPFSEKRRSIFETPETKPKRKINISQKSSNAVPISPKQFKKEAMGPEDKLETALSNFKFKDEAEPKNEVKNAKPVKQESDEERQKRFQELRDMLARMNREEREEAAASEPKSTEPEQESKPESAQDSEPTPEPAPESTSEPLPKPKHFSIQVDAFGSPKHKAEELTKKISTNFRDEALKAVRAGILRNLMNGRFDFDKATLIRAGFEAILDVEFYDVYDFSDKNINESLESEAQAKRQILVDLVSKNLAKISDKEYEAEKRAGILNAIMLGGYEDALKNKLVYSLPVEQSTALKSLLFENKISIDDKNVVRASFAGFISILELEKENEEITPESLRVLDWYYDNFHYLKYHTDFVKTMNLYIDINDYDFEKTALKFAYHHQKFQEQLVFKELTTGDDTSTIVKMAEAKPISYEKLNKILDDYKEKNNFGEYYSQLETARVKGKAFKKLKEIYNFEAGTYLKAINEIKRIRELDNFTSFFTVDAESLAIDSGLMVTQQYILIRFGFNGYNNVVALRLLDGIQPVLAWRGKTGDDSDGFRDYFKKAENELKRHKMMKILDSKFNHEILNSELKWQKVWDFLNWPD